MGTKLLKKMINSKKNTKTFGVHEDILIDISTTPYLTNTTRKRYYAIATGGKAMMAFPLWLLSSSFTGQTARSFHVPFSQIICTNLNK